MTDQRIVHSRALPRLALALLFCVSWLLPLTGEAAREPRRGSTQLTEEARVDYKAYQMLKRGEELLQLKQEEPGIKLIASIPRMYPRSKVRFQAWLTMGKYYAETRQFDLAIRQFLQVNESEDEDEQAEALYQIGICHYYMNDFDKAFMALRRVTTEFPWSVYANESYYYIGQCHFRLGRWVRAVEALKMVGTSVPANVEGATRAESGQRLYVKVFDRDLVVLLNEEELPAVTLTTRNGDKEEIRLELLGQSGEYYIGSIPTMPGVAEPGDGVLQFIGSDTVTVSYVDENTESGARFQKINATIRLVSTATGGFTDGAYREYVQGVFGDADCFLRIQDMDRDVSSNPDTISVRVYTRYKLEKREDEGALWGVDLRESQQDEYVERDSIRVTLTETGAHTGIFTGSIVPRVISEGTLVDTQDDILAAMKGDEIVMEYDDELHMLGESPRKVVAVAKVLIGEIQDVKIEHRVVDSVDLLARKNLIEAKIFLRLGNIFKEVGLTDIAKDKSDEGLERVEEVISLSLKASLDRSVVEEAFSVKWDLLLVQDRLAEAINVCRTLTRLFPDSTLVDQALLRIGIAKMHDERDYHEAVNIFNAIIRLPKSDLKAEAQFRIAEMQEKYAIARATGGRPPDLSQSMLSYKLCADTYPNSAFAGEALDKIANFYIAARDYRRASELMERVFQDYPDASFLDTMLLKWVIAAYRMGDFELAMSKLRQLLSEYPNSEYAQRAQQFLPIIQKRLEASGS